MYVPCRVSKWVYTPFYTHMSHYYGHCWRMRHPSATTTPSISTAFNSNVVIWCKEGRDAWNYSVFKCLMECSSALLQLHCRRKRLVKVHPDRIESPKFELGMNPFNSSINDYTQRMKEWMLFWSECLPTFFIFMCRWGWSRGRVLLLHQIHWVRTIGPFSRSAGATVMHQSESQEWSYQESLLLLEYISCKLNIGKFWK